jgi:hypothetical protein
MVVGLQWPTVPAVPLDVRSSAHTLSAEVWVSFWVVMERTASVRKTTLEVDEALFRRAREVLGRVD